MNRLLQSGSVPWCPQAVHPVEGDPKKLGHLRDGLESWVSEVYSAGPRLRCCFRLEEPDTSAGSGGADGAARKKRRASDWTLSYFLQASDDPSLLLPAEEVWDGNGTRRFDAADMEATMMKDLGKASRLCQKIDESLRLSPTPTHSRLNVEEAYAFLANDAWLLKESGFGVLVPSWSSGGRGSRLQIQLRAKQPQQSRAAGTGRGDGDIHLAVHSRIRLEGRRR